MPRKTKTEPDPKVQDFIDKSNDQSSSEDEPLELVIQKVRRPVPTVVEPVVEPVVEKVLPVPPKRIRKKYPAKISTPNPELTTDITSTIQPVLPDYQSEAKLLREELERTKKGLHEAKRENMSIRKNDLDTRRELMRLRFG